MIPASLAPVRLPAVGGGEGNVPKFNEQKKTQIRRLPRTKKSGLPYAISISRLTRSQALAT